MRELSIGDEIALCHLPPTAHEKALSEFLERAVESAGTPSARHVADPRAWTVSERLLALAHYCIHTRDDAPDYAVTDVSKLSDYLDAARDLPATGATFSAIDDEWELRPLTGAAAEAIEALQFESTLKGREHWLMGFMAAQLARKGEETPDSVADGADYVTWLDNRIGVMRSLPSSGFDQLYAGYRAALEKDTQFFRIWFDEQGVIVFPKEAGAATPPARFLVHSCIGELALSISGKS
ncbi:MAG TPA: hypothetical protein VGD21_15870 [Lysobacter sp.]